MREAAFLAALADDPFDATTRLVYADWLEEQGDPRAEYLRLLVALDAGDESAPPRLREAVAGCDAGWVLLVNRGRLHAHGLYQSPPDEGGYWPYLRFYDDGVVLSVTSSGTPAEVWRWLTVARAGATNYSRGRYVVNGHDLAFSTTSRQGTVEYAGRVRGEVLHLDFHSRINGYRGSETYTFVPLVVEYTI